MKIKANLHFHSSDDPKDRIDYTIYEGLDEAANLGFDVLALTCHGRFAAKPEYVEYAAKKGILLIPGIELALEGPTKLVGRHVVVLNCSRDIEAVRTFPDLSEYRLAHPEIFTIAPHPYYPHPLLEKVSLLELLEPNIDLFDAVEKSWYYSKWVQGANQKAEKAARRHHLPLIATSDTHFLEHLEYSYAVIEAAEKNPAAIFEAIKAGNFHNVSTPRKFFSEMMWDYLIRKTIVRDLILGGAPKGR